MISIESAVCAGIEQSVKHYALTSIRALSDKYGFDYDEAVSHLNIDSIAVETKTTTSKASKTKTEKVKKPEIELPFCGSKIDGFCSAIKKSHGLYNQCTKLTNNTYCTICQKQADKNSTNKPNLGDISERIEHGDDWTDPTGKKPVKYIKVMGKLNISKETAMVVAETFGISIPETEFVLDTTKKGRPKKSVSVDDSDDETEKKKRGRPVKDKEEQEKTPGDDLIASLIEEAKQEEIVEKTEEQKPKKKASEKKPKKKVDPPPTNDESHSELEEEDEIEVVKKEIDGVTYLVDQNNVVYNEEQNEVGTYNENDNSISYFDNEEEEEV